MSMNLIAVPFERLRAGVTILRSDGRFERAATVEKGDYSVRVIFDDGRIEHHERSERAEVLTRQS
jgi:nitrogen fixation protein FixH